jgi:hypothetical protein
MPWYAAQTKLTAKSHTVPWYAAQTKLTAKSHTVPWYAAQTKLTAWKFDVVGSIFLGVSVLPAEIDGKTNKGKVDLTT